MVVSFPFNFIPLVKVTRSFSIAKKRSALSKVIETLHDLGPLFFLLPSWNPWINCFSFLALRSFVDRDPSMKSIASVMLDLPEPFGPVIQVNPGPRGTVTWPLKDLKFSNLSSRSLTQKASSWDCRGSSRIDSRPPSTEGWCWFLYAFQKFEIRFVRSPLSPATNPER